MLESAVKSPPVLVEGGREDPRRKMDWAHEVDDGYPGGDKVVDVVIP